MFFFMLNRLTGHIYLYDLLKKIRENDPQKRRKRRKRKIIEYAAETESERRSKKKKKLPCQCHIKWHCASVFELVCVSEKFISIIKSLLRTGPMRGKNNLSQSQQIKWMWVISPLNPYGINTVFRVATDMDRRRWRKEEERKKGEA